MDGSNLRGSMLSSG
ncbi:hypothetical protein ACFPJ1_27135 [Kribbella qitaiheensis]